MSGVKVPSAVTLDWLVSQTATAYSLPLIYERLNEKINHPRCSIDDIAKVITEDQGLTARLLRLANSPMFGYFSTIDTISKAVTIIGTQQLRDLALAVSVMEIFTDIPEELLDMKSFWRHNIACGIVARALANYRREANLERYFAAGILHDIGQLIMCTLIPEISRDLLVMGSEEGSLGYRNETAVLGFTHADVGAGILSRWKIPRSIVEPVAYHHDPATAEQFPVGVALVHFADIICRALELGCSGDSLVPPLDLAAYERLDIPAAALPKIIRQIEPEMEETFAILGENL